MIGPLLALALQAASAPAAPAPVLDCRLTTPAGDLVAFTLRLKSPTAVLEPAVGSAWPTRRVIGPGGWRERRKLEANYHFAGNPTGIDLKVEGEHATLFVGKRVRRGAPRAFGFCRKLDDAATASADAPVSPNAGAEVPAFDSARWPASDCGLITRTGRRARIDFTLLGGPAAAELRSAEAGLFPKLSLTLSRRAAVTGRYRFSGAGVSGEDRLWLDEDKGEALRLIEFDKVGGAASGEEPAVAICGYSSIVRRPSTP